jgi:hypothetical protein
VVFLFALAQLLETYSLDRARRAVRRTLLDITPEATVQRDGQEVRLPIAGGTQRADPDPPRRTDPPGWGRRSWHLWGEPGPHHGGIHAGGEGPGTQVFAGSINGEEP